MPSALAYSPTISSLSLMSNIPVVVLPGNGVTGTRVAGWPSAGPARKQVSPSTIFERMDVSPLGLRPTPEQSRFSGIKKPRRPIWERRGLSSRHLKNLLQCRAFRQDLLDRRMAFLGLDQAPHLAGETCMVLTSTSIAAAPVLGHLLGL